MNSHIRSVRLITFLIVWGVWISNLSFAGVSSNGIGGGFWIDAPTWDTGVPVDGDSILIRSGDVVEVTTHLDYSASGMPMVLTIDGTLTFPSNGSKLLLPPGSVILVRVGGLITALSTGNGSKIAAGGVWIWDKEDGDVYGPACIGSCGVLPVEFSGLEATEQDQGVSITWWTLTESNNNYFTLERSRDGINYAEVLNIEGAGTSNSMIEYQAVDPEPTSGLWYYRVKQTDFDGSFKYSPIVSLVIRPSHSLKVQIYPNPLAASNDLTIAVAGMLAEGALRVEIRNMQGKMAYAGNYTGHRGDMEIIKLETSETLKPGLYIVTVLSDTNQYAMKLVIQ